MHLGQQLALPTSLSSRQAYQLVNGKIWLPRMGNQSAPLVMMSTLQRVSKVGINHNNIVGNGSLTAFHLIRSAIGCFHLSNVVEP